MADFLTAVKSVRNQKENQPPGADLSAVKSTNLKPVDFKIEDGRHVQEKGVGAGPPEGNGNVRLDPSSPRDALHILRSQPDLTLLLDTLKQLYTGKHPRRLNIHSIGPVQAQIINTLVNTTIPNFWHALKKTRSENLLACLSNVAGLNALVARLRLLGSGAQPGNLGVAVIRDVLSVLEQLLSGDSFLTRIWKNTQDATPEAVKRDMAWKELATLVGSGKAVSSVAQAEDKINSLGGGSRVHCWLASGPQYATWLGRNIAEMTLDADSDVRSVEAASKVLAKAMSLGYSDHLLGGLFKYILPETAAPSHASRSLQSLLRQLPTHIRGPYIEHTLRWLSSVSRYEPAIKEPAIDLHAKEVGAPASLISLNITVDETYKQIAISTLSDPAISSFLSLSVRRACIAAVTEAYNDELQPLLEKVIATFSDYLFINHAPVLQQESLAQTILLVAGSVYRSAPMALLVTARSSNHMQGVSNRLDSSNGRARWLGMAVGTALSSLVDKEGSKMSFGTDDVQTAEARWYMDLVNVEDKVGNLQELAALLNTGARAVKPSKPPARQKRQENVSQLNDKPVFGPPRPPAQTEVIGEKVTEILDDEDGDDDDDLKPYAKPDSDPEDSDEDATLVNRNKVRAPVYIRDLIAMLRDDKNHDRFQLGIKHATPLIRRKANFGAEVRDHAEELGSILCNMQDPFETVDFDKLRLQAMIAILLSDVKTMAPWFSRQAFTGEYSIAQRCQILSTLGLGGREIAGFQNQDELNPALNHTDFASKRLPPRLHAIYSPVNTSTKRLQAATADIEHQLIRPMALQAADQSTAHLNAVKVRTFSSRMEVERTKRKPAPNQLGKTFGESFFFPLTGRYQQEVAAYGTASVYSSVPFVLVTFLRTLALLLHASGPATLNLPQISADFWELLLSLRVQAIQDISVLQAVLFSLLTLLEVNTDKRRIAEEHPKQLMETQQWVDLVFERMGGGDLVSENGNEDESKVRTLAAGVLMKTREVVEAYQKQLVGYSFD